jgi:hypothetical protein
MPSLTGMPVIPELPPTQEDLAKDIDAVEALFERV